MTILFYSFWPSLYKVLVMYFTSNFRPKDGSKREYVVLDSREVAPLSSNKDMFINETKTVIKGTVHNQFDSRKRDREVAPLKLLLKLPIN